MSSAEVIGNAPYYFELSTGKLYTNEACIEAVEAEKGPRNLQQLLALGRLVVGREGQVKLIEAVPGNGDMRDLSTLLFDKATTIGSDSYPDRLDVGGWTMHDYEYYGQWLLELLQRTPEHTDLTERIIERANYLRLGPSVRRITSKKRFGSLADFYKALDFTPHYRRGLYDNWPYERFADYVEEAFLSKPADMTLTEKLDQLASEGRGPWRSLIKRHAGWPASLLDARGYPDSKSWGKNDYTNWGVTFMVVNNGSLPTSTHIDYLSRARRAPSARTVITHFGYMRNYQDIVRQLYQAKKNSITDAIQSHRLPPPLFEDKPTDYELVRRAAQYRVVSRLMPHLKDTHKRYIARTEKSTEFTSLIRQHDARISEDKVRETARSLDLYDDIWALEEASNHLSVA